MSGKDEDSSSGGESSVTFYLAAGALVVAGLGFFWNDRSIKALEKKTDDRLNHIMSYVDNKVVFIGNLLKQIDERVQDTEAENDSLRSLLSKLTKRVKKLERSQAPRTKEKGGSYADKESSSSSSDEESSAKEKRKSRKKHGRNKSSKSSHRTSNEQDYDKLIDMANSSKNGH